MMKLFDMYAMIGKGLGHSVIGNVLKNKCGVVGLLIMYALV